MTASAPTTSASTQLAVDRTRLAHDRTMMAWVRTAASLISFGFTIYKFFQYMRDRGQVADGSRLLGPREFAMFLIGIGLFSLMLAALQSRHEMRIMRKHYEHVPHSLANEVAGLVAILGVLTFCRRDAKAVARTLFMRTVDQVDSLKDDWRARSTGLLRDYESFRVRANYFGFDSRF